MAAAIVAARAAARGGGRAQDRGLRQRLSPQTQEAAANAALSGIRGDLDRESYLRFIQGWVADGASIIGGCCGIGPEHIAAIRARLRESAAAAFFPLRG